MRHNGSLSLRVAPNKDQDLTRLQLLTLWILRLTPLRCRKWPKDHGCRYLDPWKRYSKGSRFKSPGALFKTKRALSAPNPSGGARGTADHGTPAPVGARGSSLPKGCVARGPSMQRPPKQESAKNGPSDASKRLRVGLSLSHMRSTSPDFTFSLRDQGITRTWPRKQGPGIVGIGAPGPQRAPNVMKRPLGSLKPQKHCT